MSLCLTVVAAFCLDARSCNLSKVDRMVSAHCDYPVHSALYNGFKSLAHIVLITSLNKYTA